MATRINTKFVITLASVLVLLVLAFALAFMFLKKSAADHVRIAENAMAEAEIALGNEDIEKYNSELQRAASHYGNAKAKDANNTEYLYGFVDAHKKVICTDLTVANNQLDSVLAGAAGIHDTPGASDEDRAFFYELLHERSRIPLVVKKSHPIGAILSYSNRRLDVQSDDPIALKYNAIAKSYTVEQSTDAQGLQDILDLLNKTISAEPDNPWLHSALARFQLANARRILRAKGNQYTEEVNASLKLSIESVKNALDLAKDNPPAYVEASGILAELRSNDKKLMVQIADLQMQSAISMNQMLGEKNNRDQLFFEEMERAAEMIRRAVPSAEELEQEYDGPVFALELANSLVKDRPDQPGTHHVLGKFYYIQKQFDQAEKTIEAGLKIERHANASDYVRDQQARLGMLSILAEVKTTLALQEQAGSKEREELLGNAEKIIEQLKVASTSGIEWRDARVNFLQGRIALANNKPRQAVEYLDKANQVYENKDVDTLRLLAQTHAQLRNDGLVIDYYELLVNRPQPNTADFLNLINLYLAPGEDQQLEKARTQLELYLAQFPKDIRAIRLQARLLNEEGKTEEAIVLLEKQDLEKYPELRDTIASYLAITGNNDAVIELMRKRIADRPAGEAMNLDLVTRLLNVLPDKEAKQAELKQLVTQGLDSKIAEVLSRVMTTNQRTIEDELILIDAQKTDPALAAFRKFLTYQRWNQTDAAREQLDKAIELDPKMPRVIEWRFRIALSDEKWDDAQQAIKDMLDLEPSERTDIASANGRFMRAQVLAMQGAAMEEGEARNKKFREATVAYNNALQQYSHYVNGWVQLGRLHYIQKNYFAAQDSLLEALNRQNRNTEALELMAQAEIGAGQPANALERFEQILRIQPNHPTALNQFTALAQQLGSPQRAILIREQIRERVPSNTANRRVLSLLYAQSESFAQARQEIDAVIKAEGKTRENIATLSRILTQADQAEQAIQAVSAYLSERGDKVDWRDQLLLAQAYEQAEKSEQADAVFVKAVELEKSEESFLSTLAWGQAMISRGQAAKAAALFEELIKQQPENLQLKSQTAQLYLQLRNYQKAEAIANSMPKSPDRFRLLIQSASSQEGKLGIAIQRAREAAKAYPDDYLLQLNLLELMTAQQDATAEDKRDYSKLLPVAKQILTDNPDRADAMVAMADVLLRLKQNAEAIAQLEAALELSPTNFPAGQRLSSIKLSEAQRLSQTDRETSQSLANEALAIVRDLIRTRPNTTALHRSAGQAATLVGALDQAVTSYQNAFRLSKSAADLASYVGVLLTAGQGAEARKVLESAENTSLVSSNLFLRAMRGRAIAAAGQSDQAATLFRNILKGSKEPAEHLMIARQVSLAFSSSPDRAIQVLEATLGEDLPVEIESVLTSLLMSQRQYAVAAKRLAKYQSKPADNVAIQFFMIMQLALAQQESDQLTQAKASYDQAYDIMQRNKGEIPQQQQVHMLNNMAYLLADRMEGYEKDAVKYAQQALDLLPKDQSPRDAALIQDTLGWALYKAGQTEQSVKVLKESVDKYPLAANQLHLGRAYLAMGDKDRALIVLENAVDQAKADKDEKMIAETEKWYRQAL